MKEIEFPGQKEGEQIQMVIRKHWFPHFKIFFNFLIVWLIPVLGIIAIIIWKSPGFFESNINVVLVISFLIYLLFTQLILFSRWLNEELDVIIITDRRIISIEQVSFFEREFSETHFEKVEDVKARLKGLFSNLFHFGTLEIQTAAEKILFVIRDVPRPTKLCEQITDLVAKYSKYNKDDTHQSP